MNGMCGGNDVCIVLCVVCVGCVGSYAWRSAASVMTVPDVMDDA